MLLRPCSTDVAFYFQIAGMAKTILIVDDEQDVLDLLAYNLQKAGYRTIAARDGVVALQKARAELPSLIVLDLMLPELEGTEVCRQLKADAKTAHIPVIMLTAKAEEVDRVVGLELGADDYVTKPFSPRELVLRVRKILDRVRGVGKPSEVLKAGDLLVDTGKHEVTVKGRRVELTATEFKLLAVLMERPGRVQTRERLLQDVWDYAADTDTRTVDTHVRRLREKLGKASDQIETVRGVGYRLTERD
jgi:two-component system phosphate regulon response regulator PhoB